MVERAPIGIHTNAAFEQSCDLCRQLERELNAANERIKRLEEAGDEMQRWYADPTSVAAWRRAKEAKP
jgi:exonuclease VII small subunit